MIFRRFLSSTSTSSTSSLKKTAETVSVSLNRLPIEAYEDEERVQPTRSGYVPSNDPAYDQSRWTQQMDHELTRFAMHSIYATEFRDFSPLLRGQQVSSSSQEPSSGSQQEPADSSVDLKEMFRGLTARDLRMRWETMLKPRRLVRQKLNVEHLRSYKHKQGLSVQVVGGRWAAIPTGLQSYMPSDYIPHGQSHQFLSNQLGSSEVSVNLSSGLSSLQIQVQKLEEQEQDRLYALNADKEQSIQEKTGWRHAGRVAMDSVKWSEQEDLVLREAFELFSQSKNAVSNEESDRFSDWLWGRVAVALKCRKRTPDECRERMLQLSLL